MKRYLPLVSALLLASPAFAQQPSQRSLITVLHEQVMQLTDELILAQAANADDEQQIAALRAQVAALQAQLAAKGTSAKDSR
jgi:capsule polysaccharide export protein KpsE/RkpR